MENSNENQGTTKPKKFWLYIVIAIAAIIVAFQLCSDDGSSSNDNEYSYESSTTVSEDYSWIVGTWACDMGSYGTVVVEFKGDGSSGDCVEAQYGSYSTGTYYVSGNTLRYKLNGESVTTTIEIEPGHRLSAGGGYYYHKR